MAKDNNLTDFLVNTADAIRSVYDYASSFKINPQDFYDYITALKNPTGNILLTTSSSTDVTNYATATVRSASSYSLAITDKSAALTQGAISVVDGSVLFTTSLTGTFTAGTTGWFSSGSATDSSVQVGKLNRVALTSGTTEPTGTTLVTVTPGSSNKWVYASTAGYCITPGETAPKVKINGDSNLAAGNIKNGVSIFGVTGTYQGLVPTGNIELTTNASTNVTNYATATVRSASTFTMTGSAVTDTVSLGTVSSGYYPVNAKVKGTISAGTAGWFSSSGAVQAGTATQVGKIAAGSITNNTSGGTSSGTINRGSQIKIGAGWYPSDLYYTAQSTSGNIELTTNSSTNVAAYSTATVRSASSYSLAITDQSSTQLTLNSVASATGRASFKTSLTGTLTAGTSGWFSSGSATDSSVIVGYVGPAILTTGNTEPTGTVAATVTPSTVNQWVYAATAGYFNVPGVVSSQKIKVNGDSNLIASNIKQGVSIFGVTGTYSGGGSIHPDMELLASGTIYCGPRTIDPSDCECTLDLRRVSSGTFPTIVSLHGRNDHYDVYWSGGSDEEFIFDIGSFTDNLYENPFTILISCSDAQSATTSDIATIIFYLENIDTGSYAEKSQEYIGPNVGITSIAILIWATEYQGDEKLNYAIFRMYSDL